MPRSKNHAAEAARYRTKLRQAESQRDTLRQRLEAVQTEQVTQCLVNGIRGDDRAPYKVPHPGDLYAKLHTTYSDYYGEDGRLDPARLGADVQRLAEQRPDLVHTEWKHIVYLNRRRGRDSAHADNVARFGEKSAKEFMARIEKEQPIPYPYR